MTRIVGRIDKDCQTMKNDKGAFIKINVAIDDYTNGQNEITYVCVFSNKEKHIRMAEKLTEGKLILVDGTLSLSIKRSKRIKKYIKININADYIWLVNG